MASSKVMTKKSNDKKNKEYYKWVAFVLGSAAHLLNFFHRVTTGVLAPYFVETFNVSSTNLGLMSSTYFYSYSFLQPVVGVFTDLWKPRKTITISVFIMTVGTFIYAYSSSFLYVYLGRFLIGIGSAGIYIPVSWIITKYFPYNQRGFLFAILMFIAQTGSLLGVAPLAKLITYVGWRNALAIVGSVSLALIPLLWLVVKDSNDTSSEKPTTSQEKNKNKSVERVSCFVVFKEVLKIPIIKHCFLNSLTYATMMSFQGLWAIPFLMDVYQMERTKASNLVTIIPLGYLIGVVLLSKFNDTKHGKYIFFHVNNAALIAYLVFTIFTVNLSNNIIIFLLLLIGFANSANPFLFKMYTLVLPKEYFGTGLGIVNMFPFILSALYQSFTGIIFDMFGGGASALHRSVSSYKLYFLILTISLVGGLLARLEMIKIINRDYKGKI